MTAEEIQIRQLQNQHLIVPANEHIVVRDLCGVQAQFLSNAMHALRIRSRDFGEDHSVLLKGWTVRGTMHVFHADDLPLFLHRGRRLKLRPCDTMQADAQVSERRKQYFADLILECIAAGENTREALKESCAAHGMTDSEAESLFNPWGGLIRALCEEGKICCEVQEKKLYRLCPAFEPMERDVAQLELVRRYFTYFAPATLRDAAYFFGSKQAEVKKWLSRLPVEAADCGGKTYFYIGGTLEAAEMPRCIFLAGFDQLLMGYQKTESLFLPQEHLRGIFNMAGIVMPAVLLRGRVAGKWKRTGKKLEITLFEAVSPQDRKYIQAYARMLWPELRSVEFA